MDDAGDEIDIRLRSSSDVGRRLIALAAVAYRAGVVAPDPDDDVELDDDTDDVEERLDWLAWMTEHDLGGSPTASELHALSSDDDSLGIDALEAFAPAPESVGALAWAVGRSQLTVLDRGYDYSALLADIPAPWDDPSPYLSTLVVRPEPEVATARDAAEVLARRALAEVQRRLSKSHDRAEVEAAIRDVAAEVSAAGIVPIGPDGDLSVGGESVRRLTRAVVDTMIAAALARLRALNWLCGLGDWDDPQLTDV